MMMNFNLTDIMWWGDPADRHLFEIPKIFVFCWEKGRKHGINNSKHGINDSKRENRMSKHGQHGL